MLEEYNYMHHQFLKVGTRVFDVGSVSHPKVGEWEITDEIKPDSFGYLSITLKGITMNMRMAVRLEWLIMGMHRQTSYFLNKDHANKRVLEMFKDLQNKNNNT